MRHSFRPWLLIGLFELAGVSVVAQQPTSVPVARVAATVNGQPVPEVAVQRALRRIPPIKHEQARPEILGFLIDNLLIDQYLARNTPALEAKDIDERFEQIRAEFKKEGADFDKVLKELMLSETELKSQVAADLRWDRYASGQATEAALRDLFEKNPALFDGSTVHARHILLATPAGDAAAATQARAQLEQLRKKIDDQVAQGLQKLPAASDALTREKERVKLLEEAFATAARESSTCPSKANGGDVGWFPRSGSMVEPFARAAFELKSYHVSDVVGTQFGQHLILVTDRRPGKDLKYDDVKNDVREIFLERLREGLASQLRQKAQIAITPVQP